jgi:hypothetical protein
MIFYLSYNKKNILIKNKKQQTTKKWKHQLKLK